MCTDMIVVCFVIIRLLMDAAHGTPTMKEHEINIKLRVMVPKSPLGIAYPNNSPPGPLNNPFLGTLKRTQQPPQPHIHQGQSADHNYYGAAVAGPRGITHSKRSRPTLVVHQPIVNYHYLPTAYVPVPPTELVPPVSPVIKPVVVLSGFNTNYSVDNKSSTPAPPTSTTPRALVDLKELLKELKAGVRDQPVKPTDCPCNHTSNGERLKEPIPKDDKKKFVLVGSLKPSEDDDEDIDDQAKDRVAAIQRMWGGYLPRKLLEDALRKSKVGPKTRGRVRKGMNNVLLKHFQKGMKALQKTIKADENHNDTEDAKEDDDEDLSDEPEGEESHPTYFIHRGNPMPGYNNDPRGWHPQDTKGLWRGEDSNVEVLSRQSRKTREPVISGAAGGNEDIPANHKYVRGSLFDGYYKPVGGSLSLESIPADEPLDNPNKNRNTNDKLVDLSMNGFAGTTHQPQNNSSYEGYAAPMDVNNGK